MGQKRYDSNVLNLVPIKVGSSDPLDSRLVVEKKADLINDATWDGSNTKSIYRGMVVYCINEKESYVFVGVGDENGVPATEVVKESNWRLLSSASDSQYKTISTAITDNTVLSTSAGTDSHKNIISATTNGLVAFADLHYDTTTNTLKFINTNGYNEIKLNGINFISGATYDSTNEKIIIKYQEAGGNYSDLEIPVSGLVSTFDAVSGVSGNSQTGKIVGVVDANGSNKLTVGADGFKLDKKADIITATTSPQESSIHVNETANGTDLIVKVSVTNNKDYSLLKFNASRELELGDTWDCGEF